MARCLERETEATIEPIRTTIKSTKAQTLHPPFLSSLTALSPSLLGLSRLGLHSFAVDRVGVILDSLGQTRLRIGSEAAAISLGTEAFLTHARASARREKESQSGVGIPFGEASSRIGLEMLAPKLRTPAFLGMLVARGGRVPRTERLGGSPRPRGQGAGRRDGGDEGELTSCLMNLYSTLNAVSPINSPTFHWAAATVPRTFTRSKVQIRPWRYELERRREFPPTGLESMVRNEGKQPIECKGEWSDRRTLYTRESRERTRGEHRMIITLL
ncbi:hypothetical protein XA68_17485 [Ophiocordyceps unilateralis]|uniref:Uncharacterized protein n=1 Tax=Ophiocordyceps unilateralis TaxID=268505 RepID=A0A2A9P4U2_OPHUN|nr:hypothetical protein XA68_17485 [Ophiocordyceps unilateralis]